MNEISLSMDFVFTAVFTVTVGFVIYLGIVYRLERQRREDRDRQILELKLSNRINQVEGSLSVQIKDLGHQIDTNYHLFKQKLTDREIELLKHIIEGKSNNEIADSMFISQGTVKTHKKNLYRKLDVSSPLELLRAAVDMLEDEEKKASA